MKLIYYLFILQISILSIFNQLNKKISINKLKIKKTKLFSRKNFSNSENKSSKNIISENYEFFKFYKNFFSKKFSEQIAACLTANQIIICINKT